jgi:hypothetical protein
VIQREASQSIYSCEILLLVVVGLPLANGMATDRKRRRLQAASARR